jgi:hypothetical protein
MENEGAGHVVWGDDKCIQNLVKKFKGNKTTGDS